jgi:hypothetical protein
MQTQFLHNLTPQEFRDFSLAVAKILEARAGHKRSREEENEDPSKADELEASAKAGRYVLRFGKHNGSSLQETPMPYLVWAAGYQRADGRFAFSPNFGLQDSHTGAYAKIHAYLLWRCWVCRASPTKFRNGRLCTACWMDGRRGQA